MKLHNTAGSNNSKTQKSSKYVSQNLHKLYIYVRKVQDPNVLSG